MKKGQRSKTRIFKDVEQLSYGKQPSRQKLSEWTWLRTDMEVDYKNLRRLDKVNRELLFTAFFFAEQSQEASNEGNRLTSNKEVILCTTYG